MIEHDYLCPQSPHSRDWREQYGHLAESCLCYVILKTRIDEAGQACMRVGQLSTYMLEPEAEDPERDNTLISRVEAMRAARRTT